MKIEQLKISESLSGSLLREALKSRERSFQIIRSIPICKDKVLISRLRKELECLESRREAISEIIRIGSDSQSKDITWRDLLLEITTRPLQLEPSY